MSKDLYRIGAWSFLGWWLAASIFVWPLSIVAIGVTTFPVLMLTTMLSRQSWLAYGIYEFALGLLVVPVVSGAIGLVVGVLQRKLMRSRLYWAADHWRRWSILGAIMGGYAVYAGVMVVESVVDSYRLSDQLSFFITMPLFMTFVSAGQWYMLRHAVRDSWLWVLGNTIAGIVFSGLLVRNQPGAFMYNVDMLKFSLAVFAALAQGVITGYVILFLFEKKLLPMEPAHAAQPVVDKGRAKSVWDEAI